MKAIRRKYVRCDGHRYQTSGPYVLHDPDAIARRVCNWVVALFSLYFAGQVIRGLFF